MNYFLNHPFMFMSICIVLFFVDMAQFFILGKQIVPTLLCLYSSFVCVSCQPYHIMVGMIILQCLASFCFFSYFSLPVVYMLPIAGIAWGLRQLFYSSFVYPVLLMGLCLLLKLYVAEGFILRMLPVRGYTFLELGGTLLVVVCFSLIINYRGMQGNRA